MFRTGLHIMYAHYEEAFEHRRIGDEAMRHLDYAHEHALQIFATEEYAQVCSFSPRPTAVAM